MINFPLRGVLNGSPMAQMAHASTPSLWFSIFWNSVPQRRGRKGARRAASKCPTLDYQRAAGAIGRTGRGAHYQLAPKQDINPTNTKAPKPDKNTTPPLLFPRDTDATRVKTQGEASSAKANHPLATSKPVPATIPTVTGQVTGQDTGQVGDDPKQLVAIALKSFIAFPGQVTGQVSGQVATALADFFREPRNAKDIQAALGLPHRETILNHYLTPLLKAGILERTIPEKPTSRLQKYRLTAHKREAA